MLDFTEFWVLPDTDSKHPKHHYNGINFSQDTYLVSLSGRRNGQKHETIQHTILIVWLDRRGLRRNVMRQLETRRSGYKYMDRSL